MTKIIKRYVFTGPPCSGKSSVFHGMEKEYCAINFVNEVARTAIKFFKEYEPHKLPSGDHKFFQDYVETLELKNFVSQSNERNIFDRGLVDEIGYRMYFGLPGNPKLIQNVEKYRYDKIFYFPFWEKIYQPDAERTETIEQAKKIDFCLRSVYEGAGYELIEVPFDTVENRIKFIDKNIF